MNLQKTYADIIKSEALKLGFAACGISKADFLEEDAPRLENWLKGNFHGQMGYMENHFDMRLDPRKLVPGAKSVVSFVYNYYPSEEQNTDAPNLSKYAYGEDYHIVIKDLLYQLMLNVSEIIGDVGGRVFVDSAPVLERAWAVKSGLGWIGKNGNLIMKNKGSFYFIAEWITDIELAPDYAFDSQHCGTCKACIDACPTEAILPNKIIDGSKCISYFTIELREEIPREFAAKLNNKMFGCDICQDILGGIP
ncbi:MAG: tRNA epoxyqueuosine(34) reductase QueG [Bacteroidetes bacterium]|nr:tRNA epoxyqueuosine(34) reductase QueG [Bacteroidota bacterium]